MSSLEIFDSNNKSKAVRKRREVKAVEQQQSSRNNKGKKKIGGSSTDGEPDTHEAYLRTERERRKKLRTMFTNLHAMLPHLPATTDKTAIVDEAINYIEILESTLQALQKKKLGIQQNATACHCGQSLAASKMQPLMSREAFLADQGPSDVKPYTFSAPFLPPSFGTWTSPNVVLNLYRNDAQICVCAAKKAGMLTMIFQTLEKYNLDVVYAHVSSDHYSYMYMIHARADEIFNLLPEAVEYMVQLAAKEINLWISSS